MEAACSDDDRSLSLVCDLDHTLIHSSATKFEGIQHDLEINENSRPLFVKIRPGVLEVRCALHCNTIEFLQMILALRATFEIVIYSKKSHNFVENLKRKLGLKSLRSCRAFPLI